jgi:hypothetical protein
LPSSFTTALWILVPPRSMPPRRVPLAMQRLYATGAL